MLTVTLKVFVWSSLCNCVDVYFSLLEACSIEDLKSLLQSEFLAPVLVSPVVSHGKTGICICFII
jgi:hypothetical protein